MFLFIKLKENVPTIDREALMDGLRNLVPQKSSTVIDTNDLVSSTKTTLSILTFFFNFGKSIMGPLNFYN